MEWIAGYLVIGYAWAWSLFLRDRLELVAAQFTFHTLFWPLDLAVWLEKQIRGLP